MTGVRTAYDGPLPSEADIASYHEHGFWISPVIIPDDVLDVAEEGMRRFYAGERDRELPGGQEVGGWSEVDGDVLRKNDYTSLRVDELAALAHHPAIGACAASLAGVDTIRLWHDQLLYKPVDGPNVPANVGWHTDRQYWLCCSSEDMLTAWVGFHDVDPDGGSVGFVDRSNHCDVTGLDFFSQDLDRLATSVREQGFAMDIAPISMRRGQVSFHSCRTVHGSGPNRSGAPRRSIAIHLQPGENHWRPYVGPDGALAAHTNNRLTRTVDGHPDYTDPAVCPALYP